MREIKCVLLLVLLLIHGGRTDARTFFPPQIEGSIPSEFSKFVDRYLSELMAAPSETDATRRMDFDAVRLSFPLTQSAVDRLMSANGIIFTMEKGVRYSVVWLNDSIEIGRMSFPASYNLIRGTSTLESFNDLLCSLSELDGHSMKPVSRPTAEPDSANIVRREGREFYLGHLTNHQWIDATSAHAVWSADFPAESLSNLFCVDNMPDVEVDLEMESYNLTKQAINTNVATLRHILGDVERCDVYFGVVDDVDDTGMMSVLVVFHNPELAYLHKLDMTVDTFAVFDPSAAGLPPIKGHLQPYIKLHNLTDLWGEKHNN